MGGLEKKARREHRTLVLWDETGHSFRIRPGTTWARRGITPVLQRVSKRREVSSVVAITPDGRLYARHFRTSISSRCVIQALRYVRRKIGTPLLVVWDRLNAHRSRATMDFVSAHARDYAVAYLPAYAPELNPEEQCNALVKHAMANALPGSVDDLHRLARREFGRLKHRPEMIVRFFRHAGLSVTGLP
jgi:transposase